MGTSAFPAMARPLLSHLQTEPTASSLEDSRGEGSPAVCNGFQRGVPAGRRTCPSEGGLGHAKGQEGRLGGRRLGAGRVQAGGGTEQGC